MKTTSCGVLVTDGRRLLLGHATRSPRWDIPKGIADVGEAFAAAAARELLEETGIAIHADWLIARGVHRYLSGKDLALFVWSPAVMPDPVTLRCASTFAAGKSLLPEFDAFALFERTEVMARVGKNLARVLGTVWAAEVLV
jgi:8-oxo-dGTP pyrophosphatase MutT (NUDIX family)